MPDDKTTNFEFDLVADSDSVKAGVKTKPNANWSALDELLDEDFATKEYVDDKVDLDDATQSTHGLMSAADKLRLDSLHPDWNEYDPESDAYIANRPFYHDYKVDMVLPSTTFGPNWADYDISIDGVTYALMNEHVSLSSNVAVGETYLINVNDVDYEIVAGAPATYVLVGAESDTKTINGIPLLVTNKCFIVCPNSTSAIVLLAGTSSQWQVPAKTIKIDHVVVNDTVLVPSDLLPAATTSALGGVKPDGTTITVDNDGTIHSAGSYTLPTMSENTKGGAKVGKGLHVESEVLNLGPLTDSDSGAQVTTDGVAIYGVTGEGYAEQDGTPTPSSPQEIRVARGRNLLQNAATSQTVNGVTFTVNADKSVTASGTANGNAIFTLKTMNVSAGQYFLSGCPAGGGNASTYMLQGYKQYVLPTWFDEGQGKSMTIDSATSDVVFRIVVFSGVTVSNLVFRPQLEKNSDSPKPYVPYGYMGLEVDCASNAEYELGTAQGVVGNTYAQNKQSSTLRFRCQDLIAVDAETAAIEIASGYQATVALYSGGKFVKSAIGSWSGSGASFSMSGCDSVAVTVRKPDDSAISSSDFAAAGVRVVTATPVPLPSKGFAGALPDGTHDTLAIDSAGGVEWVNRCNEVVLDGSNDETWNLSGNGKQVEHPQSDCAKAASSDAIANVYCSHFRRKSANNTYNGEQGVANSQNSGHIMISDGIGTMTVAAWRSWLASNPVTVLYQLATITSEYKTIDLPALPEGAVVSIPELEEIGVSWWVEGTEEIVQHASNERRRIESIIAELATS